ncbi:uncharacterized protein NPIL_620451 [Nephila pilipes]|uniref:Uncharacterized protein n=1 Tax=Nephila pilipes TaxID=299642 RepID=A0A8X6T3J6_NEPPI|nr:uncharacterized protein NPIL_620451 [Nephila pilipes]
MSDQHIEKNKFLRSRKIPSTESYLSMHERIRSNIQVSLGSVLPLGMRKVIQESTEKILSNIRNQLNEFTKFIDEVQNTTSFECQLQTGTSLPTIPQAPSQKLFQSTGGRPKNAPLRDAFLIVRDLLWRISGIIDQISSELPTDDAPFEQTHSPLFSFYYSQYVFQLSIYVLQTVTEQMEVFSKVISGNTSENDVEKLVDTSNEIDTRYKNIRQSINRIFAARKNFESSDVKKSSINYAETCNLPETSHHIQEWRKRASDIVEILLFLLETMLHHTQHGGLARFDTIQQSDGTEKRLPIICSKCSIKIPSVLRRYSSRENLHVEKYQTSPVEVSFV